MRTSCGARYSSNEVSSSLPCIGPSWSSTWPAKSRAKTSTVKTRARCVRSVESASWCGSWPCAVRMMNASTPACSHEPSRSFIQRCRVLRRRSEEHTSELQSRLHLVCRLLLEKKKKIQHKLENVQYTQTRTLV